MSEATCGPKVRAGLTPHEVVGMRTRLANRRLQPMAIGAKSFAMLLQLTAVIRTANVRTNVPTASPRNAACIGRPLLIALLPRKKERKKERRVLIRAAAGCKLELLAVSRSPKEEGAEECAQELGQNVEQYSKSVYLTRQPGSKRNSQIDVSTTDVCHSGCENCDGKAEG